MRADHVHIWGEGFTSEPEMAYDLSESGKWIGNGDVSTHGGDEDFVKSGDEIRVGCYSDYHLMVTWMPPEGSEARQSEDWGPDITQPTETWV